MSENNVIEITDLKEVVSNLRTLSAFSRDNLKESSELLLTTLRQQLDVRNKILHKCLNLNTTNETSFGEKDKIVERIKTLYTGFKKLPQAAELNIASLENALSQHQDELENLSQDRARFKALKEKHESKEKLSAEVEKYQALEQEKNKEYHKILSEIDDQYKAFHLVKAIQAENESEAAFFTEDNIIEITTKSLREDYPKLTKAFRINSTSEKAFVDKVKLHLKSLATLNNAKKATYEELASLIEDYGTKTLKEQELALELDDLKEKKRSYERALSKFVKLEERKNNFGSLIHEIHDRLITSTKRFFEQAEPLHKPLLKSDLRVAYDFLASQIEELKIVKGLVNRFKRNQEEETNQLAEDYTLISEFTIGRHRDYFIDFDKEQQIAAAESTHIFSAMINSMVKDMINDINANKSIADFSKKEDVAFLFEMLEAGSTERKPSQEDIDQANTHADKKGHKDHRVSFNWYASGKKSIRASLNDMKVGVSKDVMRDLHDKLEEAKSRERQRSKKFYW